ncbi:hypothetical protein Tsubulata_050551 [Turnera subulata]|uniref:Aminotransferase-like plant mobile domain-containing protein n=1 Tax=Turnera subulata TaxID=218843 RepID=A0A9Q0JI08_9ROSI|nr:hypothetical protein Tsubulata_050551 [Turnera subulata]
MKEIVAVKGRSNAVKDWEPPECAIRNIIAAGFGGLLWLKDTVNSNLALLAAATEFYDLETGVFRFGETPNFHLYFSFCDVYHITGLPISGRPVTGSKLTTKEANSEIRMKLGDVVANSIGPVFENNVSRTKVVTTFVGMVDIDFCTRGYIWYLIDSLVDNQSDNRLSVIYLPLLANIAEKREYSWGAALFASIHQALIMVKVDNLKNFLAFMLPLEFFRYLQPLPPAAEDGDVEPPPLAAADDDDAELPAYLIHNMNIPITRLTRWVPRLSRISKDTSHIVKFNKQHFMNFFSEVNLITPNPYAGLQGLDGLAQHRHMFSARTYAINFNVYCFHDLLRCMDLIGDFAVHGNIVSPDELPPHKSRSGPGGANYTIDNYRNIIEQFHHCCQNVEGLQPVEELPEQENEQAELEGLQPVEELPEQENEQAEFVPVNNEEEPIIVQQPAEQGIEVAQQVVPVNNVEEPIIVQQPAEQGMEVEQQGFEVNPETTKRSKIKLIKVGRTGRGKL